MPLPTLHEYDLGKFEVVMPDGSKPWFIGRDHYDEWALFTETGEVWCNGGGPDELFAKVCRWEWPEDVSA